MNESGVLNLSKNPTVHSLNLTKESIQQYYHGECSTQIGGNYHRNSNCQEKQKEQEFFELMICHYEGDDPLKPRYGYLNWFEQNYKISNVKYFKLLEETIVMFKDDLRYKQDVRFVEVLVKYIELQPNPIELFQAVFSLGIGTMCADFYLSWAGAYEKADDFKHVNNIYEIGKRYFAQPIEVLNQAQKKFHLNLGKRLLSCTSSVKNTDVELPNNSSFSQKSKVLATRSSNCTPEVLEKEKKSSSVTVYKDECRNSSISGVNVDSESINTTLPADSLKNTSRLSPESIVNESQNNFNVFPASKFYVLKDDNGKTVSFMTNIFKPVNEPLSRTCPLALFELPDAKKKSMYPKQKVYSGGTEYQLEELRAKLYNASIEPTGFQQVTMEVNAKSVKETKYFSIYQDECQNDRDTEICTEDSSNVQSSSTSFDNGNIDLSNILLSSHKENQSLVPKMDHSVKLELHDNCNNYDTFNKSDEKVSSCLDVESNLPVSDDFNAHEHSPTNFNDDSLETFTSSKHIPFQVYHEEFQAGEDENNKMSCNSLNATELNNNTSSVHVQKSSSNTDLKDDLCGIDEDSKLLVAEKSSFLERNEDHQSIKTDENGKCDSPKNINNFLLFPDVPATPAAECNIRNCFEDIWEDDSPIADRKVDKTESEECVSEKEDPDVSIETGSTVKCNSFCDNVVTSNDHEEDNNCSVPHSFGKNDLDIQTDNNRDAIINENKLVNDSDVCKDNAPSKVEVKCFNMKNIMNDVWDDSDDSDSF